MSTATHNVLSSDEVKVSPRPRAALTIETVEMHPKWLGNRAHPPRSEIPNILSSRPSTALLMAAALASTMLSTITKLFAPKPPTTQIAGAALDYDEAVQLKHICTAPQNALNLQLAGIGNLPGSEERIVSKLRRIQTRHIDNHIHLSTVITKMDSSGVLWVREFADAHAALQRKIVVINRRSREFGWTKVARRYWPIVAVTYGWLLPLVLRLQGELQRALRRQELWGTDTTEEVLEEVDGADQQDLAASDTTRPCVNFGKEAIVREYRIGSTIGESYVGKPSFAVLGDDRKRSARKFKGREGRLELRLSDSDL